MSSLHLSVMVRSCHVCVSLSRLRSSGFTLTLHSGSSPSPTRQRFGLHEIFKCAHLKFTVYGHEQTDIHTPSATAVTLVWGSLRLAPITFCYCSTVVDLITDFELRSKWDPNFSYFDVIAEHPTHRVVYWYVFMIESR